MRDLLLDAIEDAIEDFESLRVYLDELQYSGTALMCEERAKKLRNARNEALAMEEAEQERLEALMKSSEALGGLAAEAQALGLYDVED